MKNEIVIIGAGPAGIAAAVQLKRYGLDPVVLERDQIGGLLKNANLVENYPGFPHGIAGPKLIALFEKQLHLIDAILTYDEATSLDFDNDHFIIEARNNSYPANNVVVATGTKPRPFPIEVPTTARHRVFSEVWPLRDVSGKQIVIVGAGDAAFDYAMNLASRENTILILNRGADLSCLHLLWERASHMPSITYRERVTVQSIEHEAPLDRLRLVTDHYSLITDYLLFAIGRQPAMDFLTERVKIQAQRWVEDGKLYFVGDVHNGLYRQTAIAAGEGLRAAMQIYAKVRNDL